MRSARSLGAMAVGLVAVAAAGWVAPVAHGESSPPIVATGWWSQVPLAQPVPDGGFAIAWALEQEQSTAALRIDLTQELVGTVYLELHEVGGAASDQGLAQVCTTDDTWEPANPGPYEARPEAACADGETAELGRDGSALTWLGDITALVAAADGDTLSLVVRPVGKPLAEGVPATAPFEVQLDRASLLVDTGSGPSPDGAGAPPLAPEVGAPDGFVDPVFPSPDLGTGYAPPSLPDVAAPPAPGPAPPTTPAPTPNDLVALGPVDVTSSTSQPWARLVLLVPLSAGLGCAMASARRWRLDRAIAQGLA